MGDRELSTRSRPPLSYLVLQSFIFLHCFFYCKQTHSPLPTGSTENPKEKEENSAFLSHHLQLIFVCVELSRKFCVPKLKSVI